MSRLGSFEPAIADLFCGIGGMRLAFEQAGCRCVFSCDWDGPARKTYAANFGETPHGDIRSIASDHIHDHDILGGVFLVGFRPWRKFEWPRLQAKAANIGDILEVGAPEKYRLSDRLWRYLR